MGMSAADDTPVVGDKGLSAIVSTTITVTTERRISDFKWLPRIVL
jgi:hypothetical protein